MTMPGTPAQLSPRREDWIAKAVADLRRLIRRTTSALSAAVVPTGGIVMYGAASPPTAGWLLCNGSAVSRTTYDALFAVIGTTYGAGNGTTTFNLPDFGSQFPRGNTPSTGGGAATHSHPLSTNGYAKLQFTTTLIEAVKTTIASWTGNSAATYTGSSTSSTATTSAIALDGATDTASSLPPYTGVAFLIKT